MHVGRCKLCPFASVCRVQWYRYLVRRLASPWQSLQVFATALQLRPAPAGIDNRMRTYRGLDCMWVREVLLSIYGSATHNRFGDP